MIDEYLNLCKFYPVTCGEGSAQNPEQGKINALRELARKHPYTENVGYIWKNPLNPRSRGIRWTHKDLNLFRHFQKEMQNIILDK